MAWCKPGWPSGVCCELGPKAKGWWRLASDRTPGMGVESRTAALFTSINRAIELRFFWVALVAIGIGLWLGRSASALVGFLPWFLAVMTFGGAVNCRLGDFLEVLRKPGYFLVTLFLFYVGIPAIGYGIGQVFYRGDLLLTAGHVLLAVLPSAVTSSVWTGLSGGNLPLALTLMGSTTFLSTLAIPMIMGLVLGRAVPFDAAHLIGTLMKVVAVPVALGVFINSRHRESLPRFKPYLNFAVRLSIVLVLIVNAAANAKYFVSLGARLPLIAIAVILQAFAAYGLAYVLFRGALGCGRSEVLAGCFVNGMRNDGAGVAIALAYFPPLVAIPSAMSILVQQTLASFIYQSVTRRVARERYGTQGFGGRDAGC